MNKLILPALRIAPRLLWSYLTWISSWNKKLDKIPLEKRYQRVRKLLMKANRYLHIDPHVEGKENIPSEGVCCFVSNHQGAVDPFTFFEIFEKPTCFVGKVEIEKMPFVGKIFRVAGGAFLDRDNLKQQLKVMMRVQDELRAGKCNWFIFPEGTRNKDQMARLLPFHHGTFRTAMKAGVPIVPVVTHGSFRVLSSKCRCKKYPTFIKFLKPITKEEYQNKTTEEISKMVQSMIQKELNFTIRKLDHEYMVKNNKKNYRFNQII